ncbi:pseudouridine-5'-phosphate glycosidase [Streptomyces sp. SP18CS02]|uniref:pseudouridine-5'-phosphate glycosidase n=1 Tax=Streptomyces sp. SP18CS02 TaxID=3002531 RepID=UPI002E77A433|nr:pseudouridine-5'-phosphate glycosidase [Streptomyces sp. SP18CS02]MEE1752044.1 pseudouridine-5'-phosphate glycosidase [Streptomyces sp. SP18CS02]
MSAASRTENDLLDIDEEVADALNEGRPVVALESSVLAHGPKYPANIEIAQEMDKAIRESGSVPARVGVLDGRLLVGMGQEHLERFATASDIPKVSTRDLGVVLGLGGAGATTVSSSLVAAERAGIRVFAVAGIGGVHRDAPQSFDISADLVQFTRARTAVVCAGAKSMLHPALTLEWLETAGVPVIGYRCDDFPAYFSVSSGVRNPHRLDDLGQIATVAAAHWRTGSPTSVLVTHPIAESDGIPSAEIEEALASATRLAERDGVTGPAVTPYLLKAIAETTEGRTSAANRAVLLSTTRLAGRFAAELARTLRREGEAR